MIIKSDFSTPNHMASNVHFPKRFRLDDTGDERSGAPRFCKDDFGSMCLKLVREHLEQMFPEKT